MHPFASHAKINASIIPCRDYQEMDGQIMGKKNLKMKQVGIEHLDQYNKLLRYVFQVTENDLHQVGWEDKEIKKMKYPTLKKAHVLGWFDGDNLISQVATYPMKVRIFNKTYEMGGITGVGTYPEYSNQGLMHKLLYKALSDMRAKNQFISYLYPYSIPYYRNKGWELISDKITYEINDYQLPKRQPVPGDIRRVDISSDVLKETYQKYAWQTHGALLRDELAWNEYWLWDTDDIIAAIYYNENDDPDGYVIYWIADEIFYIKDMIFMNEEARIGLWNFIAAHFSMITKVIGNTFTDEPLAFLLEDADIKESISPYYMARIVDAEKFIRDFPFKADTTQRQWHFALNDPLLPWNQGYFILDITPEGKGTLTKTNEKSEDAIGIQALTTMLLGYKRPDYLKKIGRIRCNDTTLDILEDAIEQQTPYFSDYF